MKKMSVLQRQKTQVVFPNFKFYLWSLHALHIWLNPDAQAAWHPLEEKLASPQRLQDIIYSNIPP